MDPRTQKLAILLDDKELAARLVEAGFSNPARIKAASNKELEAIEGIGKAAVHRIRQRYPKAK